MDEITLQQVLSALNTLGALGLAVAFLVMFARGEIISKSVYIDLTERIISEVMARIEKTIRETIRDCLQ